MKPCLNLEEMVPKCTCTKPCYSTSTVSMWRFTANPGAPDSPQCDLERHILQLFIELHTSDPNHDIFGEPGPGLGRLPLYSSRVHEQSWSKVCGNIAARVLKEMKSNFQLGTCWMARDKNIRISKMSKGNMVVYRTILVTRLLSFVADPTPLHWAILVEKARKHLRRSSRTFAIEERHDTMGRWPFA
ncbi:hypothetical protein V1520DRAFT_61076 [Lipomyces starkeyi]|uniref:Uncharacterized protein n=1 Tax=Lipomyces starkeyi NRRL Y-11557 TaxID=675824 RepID=A0A1E3QFD6_LIPST|nr:hypothetical protein LIPSTDRAFT_130052 [Lipomyces starkeyi NRRL Y-11557]